MLEQIIERFSGPEIALWGPFFFLLLCAFGFPTPEDIVLVAAGLLSAKYGHSFLLTATVTYFGIMIGDTCIFFMGTYLGRKFLRTRLGSFILKEKTREKAQRALLRYGAWVIFGARFLPGLRTAVFFTSGSLHFPFYKFFLMDGLAALISAPVFVYLGRAAWGLYKNNLDGMDVLIGEAKHWIAVAAVAAFVILLVTVALQRFLKKRGLK